MDVRFERRSFDRSSIEVLVEVSAEDIEGKKYRDQTSLKDISAGGAKFLTQHVGKYFTGQSLEMTIYLPGTDDVNACLRAKVTVVRVDPPVDSETGEKRRETGIAVKIDTPLYFERVDMKTEGNHREPTRNL